MRQLKVAILGTRGIPNNYGGFEYAAEKLAVGLTMRGHSVIVYNSHCHPFKKSYWNGVRIIHRYDPENSIGTAGQFVYDLNCIRDARKRDLDIILMLGYASSSIWGSLYPRGSIIITNMDGMEWRRKKYSKLVRFYLKYAEKLAVRHSDFYIADSVIIQDYLKKRYQIDPAYIAYGADLNQPENAGTSFNDSKITKGYYLLMARMEPENNIETILEGFHESNSCKKFIVIGDMDNRFGKYLAKKFREDERVEYLGSVFDQKSVTGLLYQADIYFHGHSVGGTNPSLLQAMASGTLVASHNNVFNYAILQDDALYFSNWKDVKSIIDGTMIGEREQKMIDNNLKKICKEFNWDLILDRYERFFYECYCKIKH